MSNNTEAFATGGHVTAHNDAARRTKLAAELLNETVNRVMQDGDYDHKNGKVTYPLLTEERFNPFAAPPIGMEHIRFLTEIVAEGLDAIQAEHEKIRKMTRDAR